MANVKAAPSPIVVDKAAGESSGKTGVKYEKYREQELHERYSGGTWLPINVHIRTGLGDEADLSGSFFITLKPGQNYELGVFEQGRGPMTSDPLKRAAVTVFCLWKKPTAGALITDQNRAFGGTWYWHQIHTNVPTSVVDIGVSRMPPTVDANGLPVLQNRDGAPTVPLTLLVNDHKVELKPLLPGQHYFFAVIVTDEFGNWDVRQEEFTALRRKLTVEFPTLHVYNDGDPLAHGEGEFWFQVYMGYPAQPVMLKQFHQATMDIDDWSETDRPYSLGFAYISPEQVVAPEQAAVWVGSRGIEHDGFLESDEGAWSHDAELPFPSGRLLENVTNNTFLMDCPIATDGDDFHYGVDVRWSVTYLP